METLKILLTSTYYPPDSLGGDATHVYYLANALAKRGHEIDVVYNRGLYGLQGKTRTADESYLNHEGVHVHPVSSPIERISRYSLYALSSYYPTVRYISKIASSTRSDIIHHHNISGFGISALKASALRVLYTAHDYWLLCPLGSLAKPDNSFCTDRSGCNQCTRSLNRPPQPWRYFRSIVKAMEGIDTIIAPSNFMRNTLLQGAEIKTPIVPILNFVPSPPDHYEKVLDFEYFLFVGFLSPIKGLNILINAYVSICEQVDARLVIVGDGPMKLELEERVRSQGLQDKIFLLGKVEYSTLMALYRNAIVTILPSIWAENCPLVAIESLSCGTPIIAANSGGLPEIVEVSGAGIIVEKTDPNILSSSMLKVYEDHYLRGLLRARAIDSYAKHFCANAYVDKYVQLINSLDDSGN